MPLKEAFALVESPLIRNTLVADSTSLKDPPNTNTEVKCETSIVKVIVNLLYCMFCSTSDLLC